MTFLKIKLELKKVNKKKIKNKKWYWIMKLLKKKNR